MTTLVRVTARHLVRAPFWSLTTELHRRRGRQALRARKRSRIRRSNWVFPASPASPSHGGAPLRHRLDHDGTLVGRAASPSHGGAPLRLRVDQRKLGDVDGCFPFSRRGSIEARGNQAGRMSNLGCFPFSRRGSIEALTVGRSAGRSCTACFPFSRRGSIEACPIRSAAAGRGGNCFPFSRRGSIEAPWPRPPRCSTARPASPSHGGAPLRRQLPGNGRAARGLLPLLTEGLH